MKFDFDKIININGINLEKWNGAADKDIIPMWIADMDFETVPEITNALKERSNTGIYGYTVTPDDYYQVLASWFGKRHNWSIEKNWVTHSSGVINSLHIALKAITEKNDGVIIQPPVYHPFYRVIDRCGLKTILNPLVFENGKYIPDFDDLENKMKNEKPKVMILCNPHNPVGRVFTKNELIRIGELCLKYKVTVISDEIHCDLTYKDHTHIPFASISEEFKNNSIICTAPSKTFNLAGLFTSNIIIPNDSLRDKFTNVSDDLGLHPMNLFGMLACQAGYKYGETWLNELLIYLYKNRNFAIELIKNKIPEIDFIEPEGTYFFWIDFRRLGLTNVELEKLLLEKTKIMLNQGYIFGKDQSSGFARMNIACPRSVLKKALERLMNSINSL